MKTAIKLFAAALLAAASCAAMAQNYPVQRVTLIVPYGPGGPIDVMARLVGNELERAWKQPVVVDNRPGASGLIGLQYVAAAPPDGYTLVVTSDITTPKLLLKDATNFDGLASLRPIINIIYTPYVLVTNPSVPAKTLAELVTYAKARPNQLHIATVINLQYDLDVHLFMQMAGIDLAPVPYNGGAAGNQAVLRDEVQAYFASPGLVAGYVADGKLNALAVTGPNRYGVYPNVPTMREAIGINFVAGFGGGLFAPAKTPDAVVNKIAADVTAAVKTEAVSTKIKQLGFETPLTGPAAWTQEIAAQAKAYSDLAQKLGIKPQ
jgi:tripartite-type tricarboxylate transporter receptor subunit TctC